MENKQITLREIYNELQNLKEALKNKGIIDNASFKKELIWDWPEDVPVLSDNSLLSEDWLSREDEEAWKDL